MHELMARLAAHGIDTARLGRGEAKTIAHLFAEVRSGEAELIERDGQLIRRLAVLNVDVFAEIDGRRLRLVEDRQVFADGRTRRRELPSSVAEKLHKEEDRETAVARALAEELGIRRFTRVSDFAETATIRESQSFPGILSEVAVHHVDVLIDPEEFKEEYREDQPDKSTWFVWGAPSG